VKRHLSESLLSHLFFIFFELYIQTDKAQSDLLSSEVKLKSISNPSLPAPTIILPHHQPVEMLPYLDLVNLWNEETLEADKMNRGPRLFQMLHFSQVIPKQKVYSYMYHTYHYFNESLLLHCE